MIPTADSFGAGNRELEQGRYRPANRRSLFFAINGMSMAVLSSAGDGYRQSMLVWLDQGAKIAADAIAPAAKKEDGVILR